MHVKRGRFAECQRSATKWGIEFIDLLRNQACYHEAMLLSICYCKYQGQNSSIHSNEETVEFDKDSIRMSGIGVFLPFGPIVASGKWDRHQRLQERKTRNAKRRCVAYWSWRPLCHPIQGWSFHVERSVQSPKIYRNNIHWLHSLNRY